LSFSVLQKRLNSAATQIVAFKQSLPTVVLLDSILAHMARTNDRAIMRRPEIMPPTLHCRGVSSSCADYV